MSASPASNKPDARSPIHVAGMRSLLMKMRIHHPESLQDCTIHDHVVNSI